ITPLGEFIFMDVRGINGMEKIRWAPAGKIPGYAGELVTAGTEKEVKELLAGKIPGFRKTNINKGNGDVSPEPYVRGTFQDPPKGVGPNWFYAVKKGLWVNPDKMGEA